MTTSFVIVEENHGFTDVIGNPTAPNLNALAKQFGLATDYFGVSHPSEPNYVALLGGSSFGIGSDDPYFINSVNKPNLATERDQANVSWKAYLQGFALTLVTRGSAIRSAVTARRITTHSTSASTAVSRTSRPLAIPRIGRATCPLNS